MSKLKSVLVKEMSCYSIKKLCDEFSSDIEECRKIVKKLKEQGIIKPLSSRADTSDTFEFSEDDYDVESSVNDDDAKYVFKYVGIVSLYNKVITVYPKYISDTSVLSDDMKQIIKVLEKYNSKYEEIKLYTESDDTPSLNRLPLMLYFLNDYFENGLYTNEMTVFEINGDGAINWSRTINETFALISNNSPYYPELITYKRKTDESDLFRRLHVAIISKCSLELEESGLTDLFDLERADISDETVDELGDAEFLLRKINAELSSQFNTRKQTLLQAMYTYVADNAYNRNSDSISFFGTSSFHVVWEKVCGDVFDNQLNRRLCELKLPSVEVAHDYKAKANNTLLEIIPKPQWSVITEDKWIEASDTLIPDCIVINDDAFVILDAKYYRIHLTSNQIKGQPGIGDITKQHLYELVYRDFIKAHGFDENKVRNCFLVPTENNEICDISETFFSPLTDMLNLHPVKVRGIPAKVLYDKYLHGTKYTFDDLNLG